MLLSFRLPGQLHFLRHLCGLKWKKEDAIEKKRIEREKEKEREGEGERNTPMTTAAQQQRRRRWHGSQSSKPQCVRWNVSESASTKVYPSVTVRVAARDVLLSQCFATRRTHLRQSRVCTRVKTKAMISRRQSESRQFCYNH